MASGSISENEPHAAVGGVKHPALSLQASEGVLHQRGERRKRRQWGVIQASGGDHAKRAMHLPRNPGRDFVMRDSPLLESIDIDTSNEQVGFPREQTIGTPKVTVPVRGGEEGIDNSESVHSLRSLEPGVRIGSRKGVPDTFMRRRRLQREPQSSRATVQEAASLVHITQGFIRLELREARHSTRLKVKGVEFRNGSESAAIEATLQQGM